MEHNVYLYIAVVALVTYLIRVLPLTLIRREIKNPFLRSFLYYVPYVTLAAMTFPAILHATDSLWSGLAALWRGCWWPGSAATCSWWPRRAAWWFFWWNFCCDRRQRWKNVYPRNP